MFLLTFAVLLVSCEDKTGSEAFLTPKILTAEAEADIATASFTCTLSAPRVQECGIVYWTSSADEKTIIGKLQGSSFVVTISDLAPSTTYSWYAYAKAGISEVRSETRTFTTKDKPLPPLPPEQLIEISDEVFKTYLVEHFDTDGDGEISESEALRVKKIAVKTDEIFSLEGIEHFTNLDTLICRGVSQEMDEYSYVGRPGKLRSLDLSANTHLQHLECDGNYIEKLILPETPWLEYLRCSRNRLTVLDLSKTPNLREIQAFDNRLTSLDFSENHDFEHIEIDTNPIESIDVSGCPRLTLLNVASLNLSKIDISGNPKLNWLSISSNVGIYSIDLSQAPELRAFYCTETKISSLDLSSCTMLYELACESCNIEELDISMLPNLEHVLLAPMNSLKKLYVLDTQRIEGVTVNRSDAIVPNGTEIILRYSGAPDGNIFFEDPAFKAYLITHFDSNADGEISIEEAMNIYKIDVSSIEWNITSLQGIEYMPNLTFLACWGKWVDNNVNNYEHYYISKNYHWDYCIGPIGTLKKVDVSHNPKLVVLDLSNNSGIGETGTGTIDLSNNPELEEVYLNMCYIKYPDVSACPKLQRLNLTHGHGNIPNFSNNTELRFLDIGHEQHSHLQAVDVSNCPMLEDLNVSASATSLSDLSHNPKLKALRLNWCMYVKPNLSAVPLLEVYECKGNSLSSLDLTTLKHLKRLIAADNPLKNLDLSNLTGLQRLECNSCELTSLDISGLKELEYLDCSDNAINTINISENEALQELYIARNPLISLDLSHSSNLSTLFCDETSIQYLDVSNNPQLGDLRCNRNKLGKLDVSTCLRLHYLYCSNTNLDKLDLSKNSVLEEIDCSSNSLTDLNTSNNPLLRWMVCNNNHIRTLDVSKNPLLSGPSNNITGLYCAPMDDADGNNVLETLYIKAGQSIEGVTKNRSTEHIPAQTSIIQK